MIDQIKQEALEKSIEKWETNLGFAERGEVENVKYGWRDCPLCVLYNNTHDSCRGCPVFEKTGRLWCAGTPFNVVSGICDEHDNDTLAEDSKSASVLIEACRDEVEFLKSLRTKP